MQPTSAPAAGAHRHQAALRTLKRRIVVATLIAVGAFWGLVANHIVGVTAAIARQTQSSAPITSPSGPFQASQPALAPSYFGGWQSNPGLLNGSGASNGSGVSGPVLMSGGS